MFHVDAKNVDVSITSIKVSVASGTSLEVWTKEDSALGFENDKTAWTKIKGKMRMWLCLNVSLRDMIEPLHPLPNYYLQIMPSAATV
jgi:hypothetical protein